MMDERDMLEKGIGIRKEIFGADVVERRMSSAGEFGAPLQKLINQYAYGEIWGRETLTRKMGAPHHQWLQQGGDPRSAAAGRHLLRHPRIPRRAQHGDGGVCRGEE